MSPRRSRTVVHDGERLCSTLIGIVVHDGDRLCSTLIAISSTKNTWLSLNPDHVPEVSDSAAAAAGRGRFQSRRLPTKHARTTMSLADHINTSRIGSLPSAGTVLESWPRDLVVLSSFTRACRRSQGVWRTARVARTHLVGARDRHRRILWMDGKASDGL
jgi:hypothetical protein